MSNIVNSVPNLRFPQFNESWQTAPLHEVAQINPKSKALPESFIYIDLESVVAGRLLCEKEMNLAKSPSRAQRLLKPGDILYQTVRPYQKNNYYFQKDGDYVASTGYAQIRADDSVSSGKFLYQILHLPSFVDKVLVRCTGTSYPAINSNDLASIKVDIPGIEEQEKIAEFLTAADERIELASRKVEKLQTYKRGLTQKIFTRTLRFKRDDGSDFPKWKLERLGGLGVFIRGLTYNSSNVKSDGVLVVRSSNIQSNKLNLESDLQFVNKKVSNNMKLVQNDIVICMANGSKSLVGKFAEYDGGYDRPITVGAFCSIYRTESSFVKHLLHTEQYKKYLYTLLAGTNINNLKNEDLANLKFFIPASTEEQQKIATFLSQIDEKITLETQKLEELKKFKKALLQRMFV